MAKTIKWVTTDSSTNQQGRRISNGVFEFKEDGREQQTIDLSKFSQKLIENTIASYGYCLGKPLPLSKLMNLYDIGNSKEEVDWLCAECLFELDINEDI